MLYTISYRNPLTHMVNISLEVFDIDAKQLFVNLPAWRPGRYEIFNFAKNIIKVSAHGDSGEALNLRKRSKDQWEIDTTVHRYVKISYQYYANQMDAGNSVLNEEQLYLNFINCMLYVKGRMGEVCEVKLELPESYEIACGLVEKEHHLLAARDYYELVDSPMIASASLSKYIYQSSRRNFNIWIQGDHRIDIDKLLADFRAFTDTQIAVLGEFPCEEYHFLIQSLPYEFYHGVEHANSTVITLGPGERLLDDKYEALLGISSHELFHTWNALRIRPKELLPYDFSKEAYFDTGYIIEGVTTYYGDLFLVKSGVLQQSWYLDGLNALLKRYCENFGRMNMSVTDSSLDLWLDGYVAGTPNRKVSIYNEGALIALMLDLRIRQLTKSKKSLDDVVRLLWCIYGKTAVGYDSEAIKKILGQIVEHDWDVFFDRYIYGVENYTDQFQELLPYFGLELTHKHSEIRNERQWGFRMSKENRIIKIEPGSIAEKTLSLDDEISNINEALSSDSNEVELRVIRDNRSVNVMINSEGKEYFGYCEIVKSVNVTPAENDNLTNWIGNG